MHLRTRQRVIGLLLLLLLAAILAPLVLRSPEQVRLALDMSIPQAPQISEPEIAPVVSEEEQAATDRQIDEEQQQVATAEPAPQAVEEAPQAEEAPSAAPPEPAPQDAPQPGFTVQVASFSDVANAQALVARLREAGYSAYHREVEQDGNTWQRVFVGPEIQRERAEALRQRLADDKAFALEGLVRSFVP